MSQVVLRMVCCAGSGERKAFQVGTNTTVYMMQRTKVRTNDVLSAPCGKESIVATHGSFHPRLLKAYLVIGHCTWRHKAACMSTIALLLATKKSL